MDDRPPAPVYGSGHEATGHRCCSTLVPRLPFHSQPSAGPGIRVGLTDDPDTLFGGFFYEIPLGAAGPGVFVLDPGVDIGIGSTSPSTSPSAASSTPSTSSRSTSSTSTRSSASASCTSTSTTTGGGNDDCDDTDAGLNIGLGFAFLERFNVELYATAGDYPDLTVSFGFSF